MEALGMQHLFKPSHARPEEHVVAEAFLNRKVDHRHQWDDGVEGHEYHDRQHEYPGFMIEGLVHSVLRRSSTPLHRLVYGLDRNGHVRRKQGSPYPPEPAA